MMPIPSGFIQVIASFDLNQLGMFLSFNNYSERN